MTLKEVEALPTEALDVKQICACIGCDPMTFRIRARSNPEQLGFPIIIIGSRIKAPKEAFLKFMRASLMPDKPRKEGEHMPDIEAPNKAEKAEKLLYEQVPMLIQKLQNCDDRDALILVSAILAILNHLN